MEFLESRHLMPMPDGESDGSWVCVCPSCRRKLLHFQRDSEHWHCDACHLSGIRHEDLIATIDEVRSLKEFNLGNDRLQMN